MTSADFYAFSIALCNGYLFQAYRTDLPRYTRFFLSIHLPHLSCIIPCSYWALTWVAVLPTCMTSYEISVRQTRDLPVSWYIPHIQLPSDSISRWTPLPSVYPSHYRRIRDFNPLETCAARRTTQKHPCMDAGVRRKRAGITAEYPLQSLRLLQPCSLHTVCHSDGQQ